MGQGKYSPTVRGMASRPWSEFRFNCLGQEPAAWPSDDPSVVYNQKTMFADYDADGYDSYGYSAFDADGNYVSTGGVDRNGYTEMDYLTMSPDEVDDVS